MKRTHARGAAVIIAMVVAALAATVAMAIAAEQQRWFASVSARRDQVQAQSLALAGVQWTREILDDDARRGPIDYLGEPWALPLPPTPIENGSVEGSIVDAQGLLNLNNVDDSGTQGELERVRLASLCTRLGIPSAALAALVDWVGTGSQRADEWYVRQPSPYLPANAPLLRARELAAVRGFDDAALARLLPYVTALPPGTPLNVNTAPAPVLAAALPGVPEDAWSALATQRVAKPFTSVSDFRNRLPQGVPIGDERTLAVASSYFLVTVRARQGDTVAQARALLKRSPGAWPAVVWQTLE
jgi:general secretion pathway protein K